MIESHGFERCRISVLAPQQVCLAAAGDATATAQANDSSNELISPAALSRAPAYAAMARRR